MEKITSRKNSIIKHMKALGSDREYRYEHREFICDGIKLLHEAQCFNADISVIIWKDRPEFEVDSCQSQYVAAPELFDYVSPMKNSQGPLFAVRFYDKSDTVNIKNAVVLDTVQDPGNVGTIIRTANAFNVDAVVLLDGCADLYNPKTVRATMGAIFRQRVIQTDLPSLVTLKVSNDLKLYGAALDRASLDIRKINMTESAVVIGSEGHGLSDAVKEACDELIIIPMNPESESLNAASASTVLMWEMMKQSF